MSDGWLDFRDSPKMADRCAVCGHPRGRHAPWARPPDGVFCTAQLDTLAGYCRCLGFVESWWP